MADGDAEQDFGLMGEEEYEEDIVNDDIQIEDPYEVLYKYHPETIVDYAETVIPKVPLEVAPPDMSTDSKHESPPFLTVYERTKILGTRTNQLAEGAPLYHRTRVCHSATGYCKNGAGAKTSSLYCEEAYA